MHINRRNFLKLAAVVTGAAGASSTGAATQNFGTEPVASHVGCLVDTTLCIGCRQCEIACSTRNKLPKSDPPLADRTVYRKERRPTDTAFTVVNEYSGKPSPDQPKVKQTYAKVQCMHCLTPSCVSACIVGAMTKAGDGAVVYNPEICLGCRYCQVACPFEIPAYEFSEPLKPRVRKCEFCTDHTQGTGANPACAAACPTEALVFGKRSDLITLARDRIQKRPDRYLGRIYGEKEMGGTSWLYLVGRPTAELGLLDLPDKVPSHLTEAIQHGIFRYGAIPMVFYGLLGCIMWYNKRKEENGMQDKSEDLISKMTGRAPKGRAP
jgi:Fe-S-cluster-containing dehydrogenase component